MIARPFMITAMFLIPTSAQASDTTRVFTASPESIWGAAVEVAKEGFIADRISNDDRRLRLRAGLLRAYSFDVFVRDAGGKKTRVELVLRTPAEISAVKKDAQRTAQWYFLMLRNHLMERGYRQP